MGTKKEIVMDAKYFTKIIIALKFCYFAYFFSVGCIHNFYPVLLNKIKIPNSQIGILSAVGLFGGIISPMFMGYIADKTKKTRLILIILTIITIVLHALPITAISIKYTLDKKNGVASGVTTPTTTSFVVILCILQFFVTFGDQATKSLLDGVVHKTIGEAVKVGVSANFARLRMFGVIGIGLASLISGFGMDYLKKIMPFGLPEEICLVVICIGMGTILSIALVMYTPDVETPEHVSFIAAVRDVFGRYEALICFLCQFFIQFALNITKHYDVLYIKHLGGDKTFMGIATFTGYFFDYIMMYFSPTIIDAIGNREITIAFGCIVCIFRCFFYAFADTSYMAINNAVLCGFSLGLIVPTMSVLLKSKAPINLISSYVSLLTAVGKIGATIASYIGGVISDKYSYSAIYLISASFFILSTAIIIGFKIYTVYFAKEKPKKTN
ncbi:hypothetical protein HZS_6128 [Henneguya salminicola]|nr:hypothetical protein HZS_6128 [Henneguya salminicola]